MKKIYFSHLTILLSLGYAVAETSSNLPVGLITSSGEEATVSQPLGSTNTQNPTRENDLSGTSWKLMPEEGAMMVGSSPNSSEWWYISSDFINTRACHFDDRYVFNQNGSFQIIDDGETWLEYWQHNIDMNGDGNVDYDDDHCGAPITPHDGSYQASWEYDEEVAGLTLNGIGAYIGLPKVNNQGELPNVDVPESISYDIEFGYASDINEQDTMFVYCNFSENSWWTFTLLRTEELIPPVVENLDADIENGYVHLSWETPPTSFNNDEVQYDDGSFENNIWMSSGSALVGTHFTMPIGSEDIFVHSGLVYGVENASGSTTLFGYSIVDGSPSEEPSYQTEITTVPNEWTEVSLDWNFDGDFVLAIEITTSIGAMIDIDGGQGVHSWINLGEWSPYTDIANYYGLADGEFGIRANVTTDEGSTSYSFNVYKSIDGGNEYFMAGNGEGILEGHYDDYQVENGNDYCYRVATVINNQIEGESSEPVCINYNTTDSGNSEVTFVADMNNVENFNPDEHTMEVRGSFNGWTSDNPMSYTGNGIFSATVPIAGDPGDVVEWKFKAGPDYFWENNGWELGGNRSLEVTGMDQTQGPFEPNIRELNTDYSNTISVGNVFGLPGDTVEVEVTIELDQGYSLHSFAISFEGFENQPVEFLGTNPSGSLTDDAGWSISSNIVNSVIATAAAGSNTIEGSGNLFSLILAINEDASGSEISIDPIDILLNEDYYPVDINPGSLTIPEDCTNNFVAVFCDGGSYPSEVTWTLVNSSGEEILSGGAPFEQDLCLDSDVYTLYMYDSWGDGWNGNVWGVYDYVADSVSTLLTLEDGSEGSDIFIIGDAEFTLGCMDPDAINYDPSATQDDGTCYYDGDLCSVALEAVSGEPGNQADGDDEWFTYTSTMDGYITITTCYANQPEDTDVYIYNGCPENDGYLIDGNDDAYCGAITGGNDYASDITILSNAGETYYIFWDDTWNPGPFVWYLYESPPQAGPQNLVATGGSGQVFLDWDPMSNPVASNISTVSSPFGSGEAFHIMSDDKKEIINANRPQRAGYRTSDLGDDYEQPLWVQRTDRDATVSVNLYDTWGDGYDGAGYLISDTGEEIGFLQPGNWGESTTFGPYNLADGIYMIYFEESSYMSETTWSVSDENGVIASGNVYSPVYFSIGDFDPPAAELVIDSLWYDIELDVIGVEVTNYGSAQTGGFYVSYYLLNEADNTCGDIADGYSYPESYSWIPNLEPGETTVTLSGTGVNQYIGDNDEYGVQTFGAMADYFCLVAELDESNNTLTQDLLVENPLEGIEWNIYRQEAGGSFSALATTETDPSYTDAMVTGGLEYCYYVTQMDVSVESDSSNHACATPAGGTILVNPYPIEFSDMFPGLTSDPDTVTISNGSDDALTITSVSIVGENAESFQLGDWNTYPVTISTEEITVYVSFVPANTGQKTAFLEVVSTNESFTVPIEGRGFLPAPTNLSARSWSDRVELDWDYQTGISDFDFEVDALPYVHDHTTVGYGDDYDEACPWPGTGSPDVTYLFSTDGGTFDFSLCESSYDTKIYIYNSFQMNVSCNDDECSNSAGEPYRSLLQNVTLIPGDYYIIVDGYGSEEGEYQLTIDHSSDRTYSFSENSDQKRVTTDPVFVYQETNTRLVPYTESQYNNLENTPADNTNSVRNRELNNYILYRTRDANLDSEDFPQLTMVSSEYAPPYSDYETDEGATYFYSVSALDNNLGETDLSLVISATTVPATGLPYESDFENDDGGFLANESSQWQWGAPAYGPESAASGEKVWGTNLGGNYFDDSQDLVYNVFNIPSSNVPAILRFNAWYNLETDYDFLYVAVDHDNDGMWNILQSFTGPSVGWEEVLVAVPDQYRSDYAKIGFILSSDGSTNAPGFYFDDLTVVLGGQPTITTTQDDLIDVVEEMFYEVNIHFTDQDGGDADEFSVLLEGSSSEWLSVSSIEQDSNGDYYVKLLGVANDENLNQNILSVTVTDGMGISSEPKGYTLNIVPVNDVPLITGYEGQAEMDEDTELNISIESLMVDDPDNSFPGDFSFTVFEGDNYSVNGETIEPSENYFGTLSVAVSVNDGEAESEQFEISIDVLPVNDAPTITTESLPPATEESNHILGVDFTDPEGSTYGLEFSASISGSAANWISTGDILVNEQGGYSLTLSGIPDDENDNDNTLNVTISDGENETTSAFSIEIIPVNDAPVITGYENSVDFNEDTEYTPLVYFFTVEDPDNTFPGDFVAQGVTLYEGLFYTIDGEKIIPSENYVGTLTVPVSVNDGEADSDIFELELNVLPVNDVPVIHTTEVETATEEVEYIFNIDFTDVDQTDENEYTLELYGNAAEWISVQGISRENTSYTITLSGTPDDENLSQNILSAVLQDPGGSPAIANYFIEIEAVNDVPVITEYNGETELDEDTGITPSIYFFSVEDPDHNYPADFLAQGLTIAEGDNYSIQDQTVLPDLNFTGELVVPVSVNDGTDQSDPFDLVLTVHPINDAPVIADQIELSSDEDEAIIISTDMLTIEDPDGETEFTVLVSDGDNYSVIDNASILPFENFNGTISVNTQVEDAEGSLSDIYPVLVTINPVNDAPMVSDLQLNPSLPGLDDDVNLSYSYYDPENNTESGTEILWYKNDLKVEEYSGLTILPASATECDQKWYAVVIPSDGELTGDSTFTNEVTICGANTAPVWSENISAFNINEDSQGNVIMIESYVFDNEQASSQLGFAIIENNAPDVLGASIEGSDLTLSAIEPNYFTTEPITLKLEADDQNGYQDTTLISVNILPVNDAPTLSSYDGSTEMVEDQPYLVSLDMFTAEDVDNVYPDDFSLIIGDGNNYTVDENSISPEEDYNGPIEVDFLVSDGEWESNQVTVNFDIAAVNDPPVILGQQTIGTLEDTPVTISMNDLFVSDIDNDGTDLSVVLMEGENYTVDEMSVIPNSNFFGDISVPTMVSDGTDSSEVWDLSITVESVNDVPTIENPLADITVDEDSEDFVFSLSGSEGAPYFDDLDIATGDLLNYSVYNTNPSLFRIFFIGDSIYLDFETDSNGVDTLFVMATDLENASATDTVIVTVNPINDIPIIISQITLTTIEDSAITISLDDLIYDDADNHADELLILIDEGENYSVDSTTITPDLNYIGDLLAPVYLFDGIDSSEVFALAIEVTGFNDTPTIANPVADIVVDEDSEGIVISLLGSEGQPYFDDPDIVTGDQLVYEIYPEVSDIFEYSVSNDSVYVDFMPDSNGVDTLFITAVDFAGAFATDTIPVVVNAVNDAPVITSQLTVDIMEDSVLAIDFTHFNYEDVDNSMDQLSILVSEGDNYTVDSTLVTPTLNYIGELFVPVALFDGQDTSNVFTINIQITPSNDAPSVTNPVEDINVDEDSDYVTIALSGYNDQPYFSDPDIVTGDQISFSTSVAGEGLIALSIIIDSVYVNFLPDAFGVDSIYITATDLGGLTGVDTIVVTVNPVNDLPVIVSSSELSTLEDTEITLSVDSLVINDVDSDLFSLNILPGENYTSENETLTPGENFYGVLVVPINVSDGDTVSAPYTLNIEVVAVNDAPVSFDLLTPENGTEVIITPDDIANDASIAVSWSASEDADSDEVTYGLVLQLFELDTVLANTTDTTQAVPYSLISDLLNSFGTSQADFSWTVFATDGMDTTDADNQFTVSVNANAVLGIDEPQIPEVYALHQNFPNPFNPTTTLKYDLPENAVVTLTIYDIMGREIISLVKNSYREAGYHRVIWNGLDNHGKQLGSGMYFYMIRTASFTKTKKMIMLKQHQI